MKKFLSLSILFFASQILPQSFQASTIDSIVIQILPIDGPGGASLIMMKDGEINIEKALRIYAMLKIKSRIPLKLFFKLVLSLKN